MLAQLQLLSMSGGAPRARDPRFGHSFTGPFGLAGTCLLPPAGRMLGGKPLPVSTPPCAGSQSADRCGRQRESRPAILRRFRVVS